MIVYFADRQLNIIGQASTELPKGLTIVYDWKSEDVETGVAVFECTIAFNDETRKLVEACTESGNYLLRSYDNDNEFFTIIDTEIDTKNQEITIYAEDAGLDLLNEIVGPYEAEKAETLAFYVTKFAYDSGFKIGVNQAEGLTRKLSWDAESTVTERIASIAKQFDGCEVSYSFEIKGLTITDKFINIYRERGKDIGSQLRLNKEIDSIITKKSVANLATGLYVTGGTPEESEVPISLDGYKYDDGDFFVQGPRLYSRKAGQKWSRYNWKNEPNQLEGASGYIVRPFSYDTTDQKTLFSHALTELKSICDMEVNYEVDISKLPDNARIGDRVNIIDDAGELYVSARILKLETSAVKNERKATLGEYLMKSGGISQKVIDLAAQFATEAAANLKVRTEAIKKARAASLAAESAKAEAELAAAKAAQAEADLQAAQAEAEAAKASAQEAQAQAKAAEEAAAQARADLADAEAAVTVAQQAAETATTNAEEARTKAETAKSEATTAKTTADAAKIDAAKAVTDILNLGSNLETLSNTMSADYARKTDLTSATANLQSLIEQNAAQIRLNVTQLTTIDETANTAKEQAQTAANTAQQAQNEASQAAEDAAKAQTAASNAATAAQNAQSKADTAKTAADNAQKAANDADAKAAKAAEDLVKAQQNLEDVSSRANATADEVAAAQKAVETAQAAADKAKEDAAAAQSTADTAKENAATAQTAANNAKTAADNAKTAADEAKKAADDAMDAANGLAKRVTKAETDIQQTSEKITLMATKTEVTETLGGYSTKAETEAAINVKADAITQSVSGTYATKDALSSSETRMTQRMDGLDVSISDAAKTAESFLSYDATNGLQIGNKQSGAWSGYRAQVKSDAYNILDAYGNVLAAYGADTVELGKNSEKAVVWFCGNKAYISTRTDDGETYSAFSGDAVELLGNNAARIRSTATQSNGQRCYGMVSATADTYGPYVGLSATSYEPGTSVFEGSNIFLRPAYIAIEAPDYIRITAPTVTVEGDHGITGMYYDNLGQPIRNGLAAYTGGGDSGIDPDTTLEELILTSHSHAPQGTGTFYYIRTVFYSTKSTSAARAQIAYPYNKAGATYHRYYASGAWSEWTNAAGNGLGVLGSTLPTVSNANDANKNGWYRLTVNTTNGVNAEAIMRTDSLSATSLMQTAYSSNYSAYYYLIQQRTCFNGTWSPWEWVNPPMSVGVEYRTTERHQTKAVYTKAVSLGTLPNATTKTVAHGAAATAVLRVSAVTSTGTTLPYRSGNSFGDISATTSDILAYYSYNASTATGIAQIWYTKD